MKDIQPIPNDLRQNTDASSQSTFEYPKSLLELILNSGNSYICVKDREGRFLYINNLDASLYNATPQEMLGRTVEPWVGYSQFLRWQQDDLAIFDAKNEQHYPPYMRVDKAGDTHWFDTIKKPFFDETTHQELLLIIHRDITVIKKVEGEKELSGKKLAETQKKELIGLLSGNIAHEFNNLLAIIMASAKVIQSDPLVPAHAKQSNETILETSLRAATIISRLLILSGKDITEFVTLDLNQCLLDGQQLWLSVLDKKIQLIYQLTDQPTSISGNASMLQQVFLQLILNANDAIAFEGQISLKTSCVPDQNGKPVVQVVVSDNGGGMDSETVSKIFNPLFSTKPAGQGIGLGMTLVENVVHRHGGSISVKSAPGEGSSFTLEFPQIALLTTPAHSRSTGTARSSFINKTVLLAEDEARLRHILKTILKSEGANVITASDGEEAWNILVQRSFHVDCLITDIVMPGTIDGVTLRHKLAQQSPNIPAIIMSGHSFGFLSDKEPLPKLTQFLKKPFHPDNLIQMLEQTFEACVPKKTSTKRGRRAK